MAIEDAAADLLVQRFIHIEYIDRCTTITSLMLGHLAAGSRTFGQGQTDLSKQEE